MWREPALLHVERRRNRKDVRVRGDEKIRQAFLCHQEGATRVDTIDQVVALHGRLENSRQPHRAGVVEADVDAAEAGDGRIHSDLDLFIDYDPAVRIPDMFRLMQIEGDISKALGIPVTITTRNALHPLMKESIERDALRVS